MQVEERKPKVQRSFRNLTSVADHTSLLEPHPLIQCRDEFQEDWKELYEQVRERKGEKGPRRERKWYMYMCVGMGRLGQYKMRWIQIRVGGKIWFTEEE